MKTWKKRWKEELDRSIPALREDIVNAPVPVCEETYAANGAAVKAKKYAGPITAVVAALAVCIVFLIFLLASGGSANSYVFTVEINPAATFSTDAEGRITGVMSSNADADVILSVAQGEDSLLGKELDEAVVWYTDKAAMLGFLNVTEIGSAVRISAGEGSKSESLLSGVKTTLENYFVDKGVYAVVVSETVGAEELKQRSGIADGKNVADLVKYIAKSKVLYSDRAAEGLTKEELQAAYESEFIDEKLYRLMSGYLAENIAKIEKNAADIKNLWSLYDQIAEHEENPALYLKDYWTLKKYYADELEERDGLNALIADMDRAIADYERNYGVEITDVVSLRVASDISAAYPVESLKEMLKNVTKETFRSSYGDICGLLGAIGVDTEYLSSLIDVPETVEEYYRKISAELAAEYDYRKSLYAEVYGQYREAIADYNEYVEKVISEYGSLSDYWKEKKSEKK